MAIEQDKVKVAWYKTPIPRETWALLIQRSDWKGLGQALGHLGLLAISGTAAWYAVGRLPWPVVLLLLFAHGTMYGFLGAGFHELVHQTVFKTKALNTFFLYLISFLSWGNPVMYWTSHQEHHKYTLHPPDDLEVVLPLELTLKGFLRSAFVSPWDLFYRAKFVGGLALGHVDGRWEKYLFPTEAAAARRRLFTWARLALLGHLLIVVVSLYFGWWMVPVLTTFAPFYGGWLVYLCGATQHAGLQDNVPDFRLCTRTFTVNPFVQFLYWHMNYHIEHHMYAAVPCYNLARLHAAIEADMPPYPRGLIATWREILPILERQKQDPTYQFVAPLPSRGAVAS